MRAIHCADRAGATGHASRWPDLLKVLAVDELSFLPTSQALARLFFRGAHRAGAALPTRKSRRPGLKLSLAVAKLLLRHSLESFIDIFELPYNRVLRNRCAPVSA